MNFEHLPENQILNHRDIPQNSEINSTGFMFEDERFYLQ